jgi:hypothetical protein
MSLLGDNSNICVRVVVHEEGVEVPSVGSPLVAVVNTKDGSEVDSTIVRYFWFSLIAKSTNQKALAGSGSLYTPTPKLRGRCIGVTVHFEDGSAVTSLPTVPCRGASGRVSGIGLPGTQMRPPENVPHDPSLRKLAIFDYDEAAYDFRTALTTYLGLDSPPEQLHTAAAAAAAIEGGGEGGGQKKKKKGKAMSSSSAAVRGLAMRHDQANWSRLKLGLEAGGDCGSGGGSGGGSCSGGASASRGQVSSEQGSMSCSVGSAEAVAAEAAEEAVKEAAVAADVEVAAAKVVGADAKAAAKVEPADEAAALATTVALVDLYDRFIREVVCPAMCGGRGSGGGSVAGVKGAGSGGRGGGDSDSGDSGAANGSGGAEEEGFQAQREQGGQQQDEELRPTTSPSPSHSLRTVYYQAKPSLRVQTPGAKGIRLHRDAEYAHQHGEVNWWLPITHVHGTNTLQLESDPDLGDFEPLEMLKPRPDGDSGGGGGGEGRNGRRGQVG